MGGDKENNKNSYHQRYSVTCFRIWNNDCWQYTTKHYSNWICWI